jgi:2-(3-amino-3-carboxypropyl)histidine synthase
MQEQPQPQPREPVRNSAEGAKKPPQRVAPRARRAKKNQIPEQVLHNASLNQAVQLLPSNYNFEIHKTVWRVLSDDSIKRVALQVSE